MIVSSERLAVSSKKRAKPMIGMIVICLTLTVFLLTVAEAQQRGKIPRVGVLEPGLSPAKSATTVCRDWFRQALRDLGYTEGQNIAIEYRFADGELKSLP